MSDLSPHSRDDVALPCDWRNYPMAGDRITMIGVNSPIVVTAVEPLVEVEWAHDCAIHAKRFTTDHADWVRWANQAQPLYLTPRSKP